MLIYKNNTKGVLRFGRFKVAVGAEVPAIPYTEQEEKDIARFLSKGILTAVESGKSPKVKTEKPAPVVEEPKEEVAEHAVEEAPAEEPKEEVAEPAAEETAKPAESTKKKKSSKK